MIDPKKVSEIFEKCLYGRDFVEGAIEVEIIAGIVYFKPHEIELHKDEIIKLLEELPTEFRKSGGGGWSLLNGCYDRYGELWTGLQTVVVQLFALGMAIGVAKYLMPRELWATLHGHMPYILLEM